MKEKTERESMNPKVFLAPAVIAAAGLILCAVCAPRTTHVNGGVGLGILLLCAATVLAFGAFSREVDRCGVEMPEFLGRLFPCYPIVPDKTETDRRLSGFRKACGEYLSDPHQRDNSSLQNHASQLFWHQLNLQKKRMEKFQVTMHLHSHRRAYSSVWSSVRAKSYFDGRYDVEDIYEEIDAERIFCRNGRKIHTIRDREAAHYTLLSAKETEKNIVCPGCGSTTTRSNLIDGCDYCGTKFMVEDLENRVSSFGFRRDIQIGESKRETITRLIFPWVVLLAMMPPAYFGFFGAFLYMPGYSVFARLITGILAGGLLGLLGWAMAKLYMILCVPIVLAFSSTWGWVNRWILYRPDGEQESERRMSELVRRTDPLFSIQSFFGGVQNRLYAIHFSDTKAQVNAFASCDLSDCTEKYSNVIDLDTRSLFMDSYMVRDGLQIAQVSGELLLRRYQNGRIRTEKEAVFMRLVKNAACKTQAVCEPSVMRCAGCGSSLNLMEGRFCPHCGRETDYSQHDWVIVAYGSKKK